MTRSLVLGLGVSGEAAARHLAASGGDVAVVDDADTPGVRARAATLAAAGVATRVGAHLAEGGDAAVDELLDGVDSVVVSPGVPPSHPLVIAARAGGTECIGELELGFRAAVAPVVAITGTNGKTTVAMWTGAVLAAAGIPHAVCGNIGTPVVDAAPAVPAHGVLVVEASSFQLDLVERFHARTGVILNLAADHLDWHGDVAGYARSKARVWERQTLADLALCDADDAVLVELRAASSARQAGFRPGDPPERGAGVSDGRMVVRNLGDEDGDAVVMEVADLGDGVAAHDIANAAAVAAVTVDLGLAPADVGAALRGTERPRHRRELVAVHGGVAFVNDSKATNPHAALAAIRAYPSVVLLAGGRNKGLDLGTLATEASRLRAVVAIGDAADEVEKAFAHAGTPVVRATSMAGAVRAAAEAALDGDTVLLSPGCASFDWYSGYAARGDAFVAEVRRLIDAGTPR